MHKALVVLTAVLLLIPVVATAQNTPPVADAGEDQTVFVGVPLVLEGTAIDPDEDPIVSWLWTVESAPSGSNPYLMPYFAPDPTFIGDTAGDHVLQLVVSDGTDDSLPDTVTIHVVENQPPTAVIEADVTIGPAPLIVQFDGSQSFDPEDGPLDFTWRFGDTPIPSNEVSPLHVFETVGTYTVDLTVEDDWSQFGFDSIEITVTADNGPCSGP